MTEAELLHQAVPTDVWAFLSFQYFRNGLPEQITILDGEFITIEDWWNEWYGQDDEDDEDE
jgi:hypothetical protein